MATVNIAVSFEKIGYASAVMYARRNMLAKHRDFSRSVVGTFANIVQQTAPRDTGFMAARMSTVRQIRFGGSVEGYGAGAYELVGDPGTKATPRTIASFVKNYPKLRGARPIIGSGAWWTLSEEGKEKLRANRRFGAYGGPKPAYWYAIAAGLVPNATGGTISANDFITPAIDAANEYRRAAAAWVFGGVSMQSAPLAIEGGSWTFA